MAGKQDHQRTLSGSGRTWTLALAGLSTVVLAGACSAGAVSSTPPAAKGRGAPATTVRSTAAVSPAITPSTPVAPAAAPPPQMLPAGKQGSREDVPWSLVGSGWLLATWRSGPPTVSMASPPDTLYMVDPEGGRYDLGTSPAILADWSGDGKRALFAAQSPVDLSETLVVEDLRTGGRQTFTVPDVDGEVAFTDPDGLAVLVSGGNSVSGTIPVRRYSLGGDLQLSYPSSAASLGHATGSFAEAPDGTQLVVANSDGLQLVANDGQVVRSLHMPPSSFGCGSLQWWGAASVLAVCDGRPWVVPTSGAAPTPLTGAAQGDVVGAWLLPSGPVLEEAACGVTWLDRVNPDGTTESLAVPGSPQGGSVGGIGVYGKRLAITMTPGCDMGTKMTSSSLDWYDPATDVVTPLLGTRVNGGWVDTAVSWKGR